MKTCEYNVLVLAYLGDTIYENYVRKYLVNRFFSNVNEIQKESIKYVSAKSQAANVKRMFESNFLSDDEIEIYKRGRNYKRSSKRS